MITESMKDEVDSTTFGSAAQTKEIAECSNYIAFLDYEEGSLLLAHTSPLVMSQAMAQMCTQLPPTLAYLTCKMMMEKILEKAGKTEKEMQFQAVKEVVGKLVATGSLDFGGNPKDAKGKPAKDHSKGATHMADSLMKTMLSAKWDDEATKE